MLDYGSIKTLAKQIGRPVTDLLALAQVNDPFYAGVGHRGKAAEWFAGIWPEYGGTGMHLRRIHYRLVSPPPGVRILLPDGREYQNTERDWALLCSASLAARYLGLVPPDGLIDQRNDEPMIFAGNLRTDPDQAREVSCEVLFEDADVRVPDRPHLPTLALEGLDDCDAVQDYIVEVWIEKSTQNDWLIPLCQRRGVNLVVGIGETSETRSRGLALRSAEYAAPVRILYLSDFDPGGRSMPKAVARKVEFSIQRFELDVDLQLIPVALTPDQCREYDLPRTPIKDKERRKDRFEGIFGVGATELDALEALHPGGLARLLEGEIDNWLDADLRRRVREASAEHELRLRRIEHSVTSAHAARIEALSSRFDEITDELADWEVEASDLWDTLSAELAAQQPDLSGVEIPRSDAPGETGRFVLFDSRRDYLTQLDHYHQWRDGTA